MDNDSSHAELLSQEHFGGLSCAFFSTVPRYRFLGCRSGSCVAMRRTRFAILGIRVSFALVVDLYASCPVAYRDNGFACQWVLISRQLGQDAMFRTFSSTGHRQARATVDQALPSFLARRGSMDLGWECDEHSSPRSLGPSGDHGPTPRGSVLVEDAKRNCVCITKLVCFSHSRRRTGIPTCARSCRESRTKA